MKTETPLTLTSGTWRLDADRSDVGFAIRHLRVATVRGRFTTYEADMVVDDDGKVLVAGTVAAASVETRDAIRDRRLREEFFLTDRFPHITFAGVLAPSGERVEGDLTIRDATRPVAFDVTVEPLPDGAVRLRAEGAVRRADFGLEWDALGRAGERLVADRVRIVADVVLTSAVSR